MNAARLAVWGALCLVLALVLGLGAWSLATRSAASGARAPSVLESPGDYGLVPDFTLTDASGRTVGRADLAGRFWIADFIFTRCNGICPLLTSRMASLDRTLQAQTAAAGADYRLVSFSVDPDHDTPEVLARYAAAAASPAYASGRWLFLTGPRDELYRLIGEGFHLNVARREPGAPASEGELITHSDRFVLVDPLGRIRGYYHGTEDDSVERLARDFESLRDGAARP